MQRALCVALVVFSALAGPVRAHPGAPAAPAAGFYTQGWPADAVVSIRTMSSPSNADLLWDCDLLPEDRLADAPSLTLRDDCDSPAFSRGLASGFVIDSDGYVLTSAHVVRRIERAVVRLRDRREFTARVVGLDVQTDIALLKIDAAALPTVRTGDPSTLTVGQPIVAIGSPFGLEQSVTAGIVSALRRFLPDGSPVPWIQTDAALNVGSSGGPILDLSGAVVGVASMIATSNGGDSGVAFAVPIDLALRIAAELRTRGRVVRPQLGLTVQEVTPDLAHSFGLATASGALVTRVAHGGAAERAGIRHGDIVLGVNGEPKSSFGEVNEAVGSAPVGAWLAFTVWRRGSVHQVIAFLTEAADNKAPAAPPTPAPADARLGLTLDEMTGFQRRVAGVEAGLSVRSARGRAWRSGIRPGDLILAVGDAAVDTVAEFDAMLARIPPDRPAPILLRRRDALAYVAVAQQD